MSYAHSNKRNTQQHNEYSGKATADTAKQTSQQGPLDKTVREEKIIHHTSTTGCSLCSSTVTGVS